MTIQDERPLSAICVERDSDPVDQRKRIVALLKEGANVDETDQNGVTPLHHAVRFRSPVAVETLIQGGASVNQRCKRSGSTPLHRAVTSTGAPGTAGKVEERLKIIRLLLDAGADPTIMNRQGKMPLDYVADKDARALLAG